MSIRIVKGDITQISADAIVNPANSLGYMGGGVAGALKRVGGTTIEKEALSKAPIPVGSAIATTAGNLAATYVIHAPTMQRPAMRISADNVKKATRAAFTVAQHLGVNNIAIPGMGTGVGGVSSHDAAQVIVNIAKEFTDVFQEIILIDRNDEMIEAFHHFLTDNEE